jgi:hypothetical protein
VSHLLETNIGSAHFLARADAVNPIPMMAGGLFEVHVVLAAGRLHVREWVAGEMVSVDSEGAF